ncbi:Zn-dependent alcohol dehydrogenase [Mycobacteroides abscessus subsp. abscessus]|uniref:zinc-dependent alcohol dehydrogenase n=1 Tax=Mycobacteroides abscessus TaxID=36809 RepID=UPI000926FD54|nr:alcohol dehydrogenase catalytic domain-containing protein [Mycobacteroides abscessus]SHU55510.1 Zn-dependent alcohol dehydrogenase [Mycobacteroides abscessus subsp. abscessus]SHX65550.1 Zn-dependent alcohol dehydrogenase [Mycobacteroides abscessus subsp. abscessus]SIG92742.1 Zn-dependent alcohol dehydrogenase [Mycobacteroides abscessus subsp. abscessus]SKD19026.1 Zn-dependent alcohol dehydrogenase [Mycobacteroides abscessus subsp. abscessus]SKM54402.1 Zn-dependent alcohol dehydrogenase [Myc
MRSLMFVKPGLLRFDDVEVPTLIDPTDALVRPLAATTCDLDHHVIADKTPFSGAGPFPLGHECVGTVIDVGPECTTVAVGDVVGVAWHIACGTCAQCLLGHPARCLAHGDAQYGLPINGKWGGTFSELIRVPFADYNLAPLPAGVDPIHLASIGDNLALGWETVMPTISGVADPQVAVFGGTGSIGLYCVDVAVHCAGARTVYYDDDSTRMAVAEKLGADIADINGKREKNFHLAVDASCDPDRLRKALVSVIPEGHVNSVGIYFADVTLPLLQLYLRGVHFHNGKGHARPNMTPTLDAVAAGALHPELVTSGIYAWDDIPEVLTSPHAGHKPIFVLDP